MNKHASHDVILAFESFLVGHINFQELIDYLERKSIESKEYTYTVSKYKDEYHLFRNNIMVTTGVSNA